MGNSIKRRLASFISKGHPWNIIPGILKQQMTTIDPTLQFMGNNDFLTEIVTIYQGLYPLSEQNTVDKPCYAR